MIGRIAVGQWVMIAVMAGIFALPLIAIGIFALDSPETLYRFALRVHPDDPIAPDVNLDPTRKLGGFMLAAGIVLGLASVSSAVMLIRWKTPKGPAGPTDAEEMRRRRKETEPHW